MWKVICCLAFVVLVGSSNLTDVSQNNKTISTSNITRHLPIDEQVSKTGSQPAEPRDNDAPAGSKQNPFDPANLATFPDDGSLSNFKYYFLILVVSSLSVISIIIFKALGLRKSRAEQKYGKANTTDKSETEPLGRSKWLEESSDENEDEIFDINFLKNSRTQNAV